MPTCVIPKWKDRKLYSFQCIKFPHQSACRHFRTIHSRMKQKHGMSCMMILLLCFCKFYAKSVLCFKFWTQYGIMSSLENVATTFLARAPSSISYSSGCTIWLFICSLVVKSIIHPLKHEKCDYSEGTWLLSCLPFTDCVLVTFTYKMQATDSPFQLKAAKCCSYQGKNHVLSHLLSYKL